MTKESKRKFEHHLPFRCDKNMHDQIQEKVERLGFDSISSYMRVLVRKDLQNDYVKGLE